MNGSTLVHLSTVKNGTGWCIDQIGFGANGKIIVTGWNGSYNEAVGPVLPIDTWTHVVNTYSTTNGHRLYVNGTMISTTGPMTYLASNSVYILTLGNPLGGIGSCISQSIVSKVYSGSIDEFRVYSRELNTTDIHSLTNI